MPRSHAGLVPKRITENVHSEGGHSFVRHRTIWVRPSKTARVKARGANLLGERRVQSLEQRFQGMDISELKLKKDAYKQRIIDLNKVLLGGGLPKEKIEVYKRQKKEMRAKRELLKRVLKHKRGKKRESSEDYSNFSLNITKVTGTARDRLMKLIDGDPECNEYTKTKVSSRRVLSAGATDPEKVVLSNGKKAIFKPQKNEINLRGGVPVGTYFLREICAYEVSKLLGFNIVPPTSYKIDKGRVGSIQEWVAGTTGFAMSIEENQKFEASGERIKLSVFDSLLGNTDRHGGNYIYSSSKKKIWAIDNGLSFNEDKSVYGDWRGDDKIPKKYVDVLKDKKDTILTCVSDYLGDRATSATKTRLEYMIKTGEMYKGDR